MSVPPLSPEAAAESAMRAGLSLGEDRHAAVAGTAHHVLTVISRLREIDLGETPPASVYHAGSQGR
ncbi:hypothetical protein ABZZ17_34625 [Streptomyces sp. NPDC006512]|uniref:hypothetical protein n=1 Tax=Streptomyces sp. NPDC006512 TaxID=3154307 RepID=UPI00339E0975